MQRRGSCFVVGLPDQLKRRKSLLEFVEDQVWFIHPQKNMQL